MLKELEAKLKEERDKLYTNLSPWQRVQIVRHPQRPYTLDYLKLLADDFTELSGDRCYGNDRALIGGLAQIGDEKVVVIGHQKGHDTKQNIHRNFGLAHPEGYRKALRLMKLADKFRLPVVSFIDTPGAYPGIASEERHIAEAIAVNLREMFTFNVPIVAVVLGEGGSGGALGIGVADRVLILENSYYSVISPEGCAAIPLARSGPGAQGRRRAEDDRAGFAGAQARRRSHSRAGRRCAPFVGRGCRKGEGSGAAAISPSCGSSTRTR